tara:strand:+ start:11156 stop:11572 length:417 start_codon:yes stop_codon:yes gene_type:complete
MSTQQNKLKQAMAKYVSQLTDENVLYRNTVYNGKEYKNRHGLKTGKGCGFYKNGIELFIYNGNLIMKTYTVNDGTVIMNFTAKINHTGKLRFFKINYFGLGMKTHKGDSITNSEYDHVTDYLNEADLTGLKLKELKIS